MGVSGFSLIVFLAILIGSLLWLRRAVASLKKERNHFAALLLSAQEEERKRIARELHDETSQILARLILGMEKLIRTMPKTSPELNEMITLKELTGQSLADIQRIMFTLRPSLLDDIGLKEALGELLRQKLNDKGVQTTFSFEIQKSKLSPELEIALFRIAEEAVSNIQKYAKARHAALSLERIDGKVNLVMIDDGIGFDLRSFKKSRHQRFGLWGIEERVSILGGNFELHSAPGQGTTLSISLPAKGIS